MTQHEADNSKPQPDPMLESSNAPEGEVSSSAESSAEASLDEILSLFDEQDVPDESLSARFEDDEPEGSDTRQAQRDQVESFVDEIDTLLEDVHQSLRSTSDVRRPSQNVGDENDDSSTSSVLDSPSKDGDQSPFADSTDLDDIGQLSRQVAGSIDDQLLDDLDQLVVDAMESGLTASRVDDAINEPLTTDVIDESPTSDPYPETDRTALTQVPESRTELADDDLFDSIQSLFDETSDPNERTASQDSEASIQDNSDPGVTVSPPDESDQEPTTSPAFISSDPLIANDDPELQDLSGALDDLIAASLKETPQDQHERVSRVSTEPMVASESMTTDDIGPLRHGASEAIEVAPVPETEPSRADPMPDSTTNTLTEPEFTSSDDVNEFIASDPDGLESVLDSIFDEQAIFVEVEPGVASTMKPDDVVQVASMEAEESLAETSPEGDDTSDPVVASKTDDGGAIDELVGDLEEVSEIVSQEVDREIGVEPDQAETAIDEAKPSASSRASASTPENTPSTDSMKSSPDSEQKHHAIPGEKQNLRNVLWTKAEPPLLAFFRTINWPMRFVPRKARASVDWLALSLVFWVPVVWVVALIVIS
ncbi:MAG: hypothetical protein O7G85_12790 [Planctomycetota bacterium]|nr:hypothetical protein [Planctomycetota bacterium]